MKMVTLIGMSGAGKSAVAERLAQLRGGHAVDVDALIELVEQKPLPAVLESLGEEAFLALEGKVLGGLVAQEQDVVATGGSAVLSADAMQHMRDISTIVYLHAPFEVIEKRIGAGDGRGIVGLAGKTLREIYDERLPLYETYAHHTFDAVDIPEKVAQSIDIYLRLR